VDFDAFLREVCPGLDLSWRRYRRRQARRRVLDRVVELGLPGLAAYRDLLRTDPAEAARLPDLMRVTVSRFFRERERWQALAQRVLPRLLEEAGPVVRAWSVGCCGGEEPYTLVILWHEAGFGARPLEVLATDIDRASLDRAREAWYQAGSVREVPPEVRDRWFVRDGRGWRLRPEARTPVRLVPHNLMHDPPPRGMDLVLCRYLVFTYYRGERRARAARILRRSLRPGGALMIGRKEGPGPLDLQGFEPWPGAPGVYRKVEDTPGLPTGDGVAN